MKKHWWTLERKQALEGYIFLLPWFIGFSAFFIYPFFMSIKLSFSDITKFAGFEMKWIGFDNYIRAFTWDINFLPMFLQTIEQALTNLPVINIFALFLAILLNRRIRLKGLFRAMFFLPVLLGTGYVMQQLLGQGVAAQAIDVERGIAIPEEVLLYMGPTAANIVQIFLNQLTLILWKSGVQIVLFLAGLQGISSSLYESARCDGATEWEMFWKITLPMMSPVILLSLVYTLIDSFTDVSNPIVNYVRDLGFRQTQYEYGAAMGWIYFMLVFILVMLVFAIARRYVYDAAEK